MWKKGSLLLNVVLKIVEKLNYSAITKIVYLKKNNVASLSRMGHSIEIQFHIFKYLWTMVTLLVHSNYLKGIKSVIVLIDQTKFTSINKILRYFYDKNHCIFTHACVDFNYSLNLVHLVFK